MHNQKELKLLENYYDLFSEKIADIDKFYETAKKTLVDSCQIGLETLNFFIESKKAKSTILIKEEQVSKLQAEIDALKKKFESSYSSTINFSKQSSSVIDDCRGNSRTTRSGC